MCVALVVLAVFAAIAEFIELANLSAVTASSIILEEVIASASIVHVAPDEDTVISPLSPSVTSTAVTNSIASPAEFTFNVLFAALP